MTDNSVPNQPHVFLSYAWEDRALAEKIATSLRANGIDAWWAEWEITAGDSLRQKIEEGLSNCSHFVVLLTPNSISKPWVQMEIDAGLVRKIGESSKFIALRHNLPPSALTPLLSSMLSPEIDDIASNIGHLVNDIYSVQRKPPLGPPPTIVSAPMSAYSQAAMAVAKLFVTKSKHGVFGDMQMNVSDVAEQTGLSTDDVRDAVHEMGSRFNFSHDRLMPKDELYSEFDEYWMEWNPAQDALRLASDLQNNAQFPTSPAEIAALYDWRPRRLNPAMTYLIERNAVRALTAVGAGPYVAFSLRRTDDTRRFVKSRS